MSDARSLLRAARADRRITHPHASYDGAGKLSCNLCSLAIKPDTDAGWKSHLHSTGHTLRLGQQHEKKGSPVTVTKKRKAAAVSDEPEELDARDVGVKKSKPSAPADADVSALARQYGDPEADRLDGLAAIARGSDPPPSVTPQEQHAPAELEAPAADVDEEEMAAFQRELAAMEQKANDVNDSVVASGYSATISAAPMTAEEIAAQAREEQSAQRGKRDAELEAEKEDAEDALQEELAEMEQYESRVKKLREQREALRKTPVDGGAATGSADAKPGPNGIAEPAAVVDGEEDDDDEDDVDDGWGFGAT